MAAKGNVLLSGQALGTWDYLVSQSNTYIAVLQSDGNFCVYAGSAPAPNRPKLWCSGNTAQGGTFYATMQGDGNLCVYHGTPDQQGPLVWGYLPQSLPTGPYFAIMQDDGHLVVYRGTPEAPGPYVWASNFGLASPNQWVKFYFDAAISMHSSFSVQWGENVGTDRTQIITAPDHVSMNMAASYIPVGASCWGEAWVSNSNNYPSKANFNYPAIPPSSTNTVLQNTFSWGAAKSSWGPTWDWVP